MKFACCFILGLNLLLASCKKPEGPGGKATIKGKIYATDFDNTQLYKLSEGYVGEERVYISYGSNQGPDNDVRTGSDGSFQFKFLNKGSYKLTVYSLDTAIKQKGNDTKIPIVREVKISNPNQVVIVDDIIINR